MQCGMAPERIREYLEQQDASIPGKKASTLWVDVKDPTAEDWRVLIEQFAFHPLAIEDAQKQGQRAKVDAYEGYLFLSVLTWANEKPSATDDVVDTTREIDVFLGPNYLVTIHQGTVTAVQETRQRWERNPRQIGTQPAYLLYMLLDTVVDEYFPAMDAIDDEIDDIETALYADPSAGENDMMMSVNAPSVPNLRPALRIKKRLLLLRQAVAPLRDVLNYLLRTDDPTLLPPELRVFHQDVYDHALRIVEQVDLHRDILGGVMDTMMAQASNRIAETSNRLNQVMKTMTAISTILMSAALISGIYGMNFKYMPELDWRFGYEYSLGLMGTVTLGLALFFRRIRWL